MLISVIIPVYNAQETIRRCIKSIIATKAEIEIICIDDGSIDGSYDVLQDLSRNDNRLILFRQENKGAGEARNLGLKAARGEFIMFCDADDCYSPTTIDYIVEDIEKFKADYIVFHRKTILSTGEESLWGRGDGVGLLNYDWAGYLNNCLFQRGHGGGVVTKVFKRDIISSFNLHFEHFLFGEDYFFNLVYICRCQTFLEDYRAYYHQYQTQGSICLKPYKNYLDLNMQYVKAFQERYPEWFNQLQSFFAQYYYETLVWSISRGVTGVDANDWLEKWRLLKDLFGRKENEFYLSGLLEKDNLPEIYKRNSQYILRKDYCRYLFKNFCVGRIKRVIVSIINIKKK